MNIYLFELDTIKTTLFNVEQMFNLKYWCEKKRERK